MDNKNIIILGFILFLLIFSCVENDDNIPSPAGKILKRVVSPDSLVEAVLVEQFGDATTSNSWHIYLTHIGEQITLHNRSVLADHAQNIDLFWKENKFLVISYDQARIFEFSNFWQSDKLQDWSYVVEIRLQPRTDSFSLSESDRWILNKSK